MELFVEIIGWVGAAAVLIAYGLNSTGKMKADSVVFQVLNLVGAVFLIVRTWFDQSWPSMIINIVWTIIAIIGLIRIGRKS